MTDYGKPRITIDEFERLAAEKLPLVVQYGIRAEVIEAGRVVMRMPFDRGHLRPGGTVSGPVMLALARSEERRVGKGCRSWWSPYH